MPDSPDILMTYTLTGDLYGNRTINTFWLRSKQTADTTNMMAYLVGILDEFEVFLLSSIQQLATNEWTITQAVVEVLAGALPFQAIRAYTTKVGARTPVACPPHDAMLLSIYTPYHGKRNHGRYYFAAVPEGEQTAGLISNTHLTRLDNLGTLLVSRFGETGNSPNAWVCVFSRKNGVQRVALPVPHLQYDPLAAIPITRAIAHREVATQRHRKVGRGI
jgi:hypothetical protein